MKLKPLLLTPARRSGMQSTASAISLMALLALEDLYDEAVDYILVESSIVRGLHTTIGTVPENFMISTSESRPHLFGSSQWPTDPLLSFYIRSSSRRSRGYENGCFGSSCRHR